METKTASTAPAAVPTLAKVDESQIEKLTKQLAEEKAKVAKLEARNEVWILAEYMPTEVRGDQKQVVTLHPELGFWFAEHEAEKGRRNRQSLKPHKVVRAE